MNERTTIELDKDFVEYCKWLTQFNKWQQTEGDVHVEDGETIEDLIQASVEDFAKENLKTWISFEGFQKTVLGKKRGEANDPELGPLRAIVMQEGIVEVDGNKFEVERLGIRMTLEFPGITEISEGAQETLVSLLWNHFGEFCVHLGNTGLADAAPYPEAFAEDKVRTW